MRTSSVEYRLGKILEHDWRAEAAELLKAREAGSAQGPVSVLRAFFLYGDSLLSDVYIVNEVGHSDTRRQLVTWWLRSSGDRGHDFRLPGRATV